MQQPRNVVFGGGSSSSNSTTLLRAAPTTLRLDALFYTALCKAACLPLFSVSRDFYKVAALRCCFLRARAATRYAALALRSSAARALAILCSSFASSAMFFLYSIAAALRSQSCSFYSFSTSSSRYFTVSRT
jgi:lauroyl/myristoyl acyltransferase